MHEDPSWNRRCKMARMERTSSQVVSTTDSGAWGKGGGTTAGKGKRLGGIDNYFFFPFGGPTFRVALSLPLGF